MQAFALLSIAQIRLKKEKCYRNAQAHLWQLWSDNPPSKPDVQVKSP